MAAPLGIGRYEVRNRIGHGGMGTLYLAHDPKIDRLVVIKVLKTDIERDELRTRFDREARAIGALTHPNIVVIYDYGDVDGSPFIVMEYIRGENLREMIERRSPMTVIEKLRLLEQLCAGLAYAHGVGILHRDIKPANLMVDPHGSLKILDFGIARLAEAGQTRASGPVGTPGYMAPEQIRAQPLDGRSDLFAVGAVAYELVCYAEAFPGASYHTILHRVLNEPPTLLSSMAPGVDPELEAVILQALDKDPARRYQDATTLMQAFERVRVKLERTAPAVAPDVEPLAQTIRISRPVPAPAPAPERRVDVKSTPAGRATLVQQYLDDAQRALDEGDYQRADAALRKVEELNASDTRLHVLRDELENDADGSAFQLLQDARAHIAMKEFTQADGLLAEARRLAPQSEELIRLEAEVTAARTARDGKTKAPDPVPAPAVAPQPAVARVPAVVRAPVDWAAIARSATGRIAAVWAATARTVAGWSAIARPAAARAAAASAAFARNAGRKAAAAGTQLGPVWARWHREALAVVAVVVAVTAVGLFMRKAPTPPAVKLTITSGAGGAVLVNGKPCVTDADCSFHAGDDVELRALPDPGFAFASFGGACDRMADGAKLHITAAALVCSVAFTNVAAAAFDRAHGLVDSHDYAAAVDALVEGAQKNPADARFADLLGTLPGAILEELKDPKGKVTRRTGAKYLEASAMQADGERLLADRQFAEATKKLAGALAAYRDAASAEGAPPPPPAMASVKIAVSPGGAVLVGADEKSCTVTGANCTLAVRVGELVRLQAKPETGYFFAGFANGCDGVANGGNMKVVAGASVCTATFTQVPLFDLRIVVVGGGTITVGLVSCNATSPCKLRLREGESVVMDARQPAAYQAPTFAGVCDSRTFMMPALNSECRATFAAVPQQKPVVLATGAQRSFTNPDGSTTKVIWVQAPPDAGPSGKGFFFDQALVSKERFKAFITAKPEFQKGPASSKWANGGYLTGWTGTNSSGSLTDPVMWVSHEAARSYCSYAGGRLPTDNEWDRATKVPGVGDVGAVWEWLSDQHTNRAKPISQDEPGAKTTAKDLGFRCVRDESAAK